MREQVVKLPAPLLLSYDDRSGDTSSALLALIARVPPELWGFRLGLKLLEEVSAPMRAVPRALPRSVGESGT